MLLEQERFIDVKGGRIWTQKIYHKSTMNEIPLIFLHGGPGSTHHKLKWGLRTLATERPLFFYDQLGGGKSGLSEKNADSDLLWTIERFVGELDALIKSYALDQFILFGTSWGASLALEYYFSNTTSSKPVAMVINSPLVSTRMWMDDAEKLKKAMPENYYSIMVECEKAGNTDNPEYRQAMQFFYSRHLLQPEFLNEEQWQLVKETENLFNIAAYFKMWGPSEFYASGSLLDYDRYADLSRITVPVFFCCGEFDEATPATVEKFHNQLPGSLFEVMIGCSHQAYFEMPDKFKSMLSRRVDQLLGVNPYFK